MMEHFFDTPNTLIILASCANFFFVLLVLLGNKHGVNKSTGFFIGGASSVVLWSVSMLFFRNVDTSAQLALYGRILYATATLIPLFFVLFTVSFNKQEKIELNKILLISFPAFCVVVTSLVTGFLIEGVVDANPEPIVNFNFWLQIVYIVYHATYFLAAFIILFRAHMGTNDDAIKNQLRYIFVGTFITASVSMVTNLLLPLFGFFDLNWLGQAMSVVMIAFIALSLLQDKIFALQAAVTRLAIIILGSFLLVRILVATSFREQIVDIFIFLFSGVFGYVLDKSVRQVIQQREKISELAKRLTETNWELAKTNERLRVIDQRKSEFVSIVSHQLRTPITAIKGYTSLLLEDAYGSLSTLQKTQIEKVFISANRLAEMVNDFLDISKIEQGTMQYVIAEVDVKKMITELFDDFLPVADKKGLTLDFECSSSEAFVVSADAGKLRQIFSNIFDNSIKYTPKGKIVVSLQNNLATQEIICKVKDSGIGLSQDDLHHLFGKFTRGSQGQSQNTDGSGLGLYIAQKMLEAMKGKVWVDSEGPGKGSTFVIVLAKQ